VDRIEHGERQMAQALEGQTRLVREVHHRVKNNLQVVASLLSIHGRTAEDVEAKAAYAAIGRRVDALSVVHRNHYAELEENQGIALRPMLTELAAGLRASSPEGVLPIKIELELDNISTTQDVAVATAFLITEVVEY
jgi:two-component sensor histidine kinase